MSRDLARDAAAAPVRPRCLRCGRPGALCFCRDLPSVPTRTRVVVLQHPHERDHPFGTARLVKLCMPNAEVHVPWAGCTGTLSHPVDVGEDAVVLYPHPDARALDEVTSERAPSTLIAVDGTWGDVKRLYRENEWLHRLRHVRLSPREPSRYRIRKEPRADYVSTLEAIVEALRVLEPDHRGLDALLTAFDRMIDGQLQHRSDAQRSVRRKLRGQRPSRRVAAQLADPRLVVVYGEASLPGGEPFATRELVHWVAMRVGDEAVFEALLRPNGALPSAEHLRHMQLAHDDVARGEAFEAARQRFAEFAGAAPLAAWTGTTFAWGRSLLPAGAQQLVLKPMYCNVQNHKAGLLDEVVARAGLQPVATGCRGRAGSRLGNAVAMARWLAARVEAERRT